jgi:ParB family chromosome partitioning protein
MNAMCFLKLSQSVQDKVSAGAISAGHARAVLMAPQSDQETLAQRAATEGWSVRRTEKEAKTLRDGHKNQTPTPVTPAHRAVEDQLRAALGAPVKLVQKKGVGRIEIRFHSIDELERLIDMMATLEGS